MDPGFFARGWIEPVFGEIKEGHFDVDKDYQNFPWLTFFESGAPWTDARRIEWPEVNSVRLLPRADLTPKVSELHAELLNRKGCTDPYVIVGWLAGAFTGVPNSDLFVLVPVAPVRTSGQWMSLFSNVGIQIRTETSPPRTAAP